MLIFCDPIEALLRCVDKRWPDANIRVQFSDQLPKKALGTTEFPPDGEDGPAIITLRPDLKGLTGTLDILAHECAHAVTGTEHADDHGPEWRQAYDTIHEDFCALEGFFPMRTVGESR